jgi:hypothetical protein
VALPASHFENVTEPQLDAVSSSLRPGKFATAFCSGRCASVSWFKQQGGRRSTFPPWRTSAAWQHVRVSYAIVSDHCKPSAGYLRLLSEAASPRGGKAPGQNGQVKYRASPGVEVLALNSSGWRKGPLAAASTFHPGTSPDSGVHLRRKARGHVGGHCSNPSKRRSVPANQTDLPVASKRGRRQWTKRDLGGLAPADVIEICKWGTPAADLLDVDHSFLSGPQAADVIALCLNG